MRVKDLSGDDIIILAPFLTIILLGSCGIIFAIVDRIMQG